MMIKLYIQMILYKIKLLLPTLSIVAGFVIMIAVFAVALINWQTDAFINLSWLEVAGGGLAVIGTTRKFKNEEI